MKIKSNFLIFLIFLFVSSSLYAQNENSLIWKISGKDLDKPSYIFGTIHAICTSDFFLKPKVEQALLKSDVLITEINFGDLSEILLMQESAQSEIPLTERLEKKQYIKLKKLLKEKVDIAIEDLNFVSESGIISMITLKSFACEDISMYEVELLQKALLAKKKLNGLETISEQLKLMDNFLDINATIKMLEEMHSPNDLSDEMIVLYKQERIDDLFRIMQQTTYMDSEAYDEFLVNRNSKWVKKMPELMKMQSCFFAVGAAHLGGDIGVLELLRKQGYRIEAL